MKRCPETRNIRKENSKEYCNYNCFRSGPVLAIVKMQEEAEPHKNQCGSLEAGSIGEKDGDI